MARKRKDRPEILIVGAGPSGLTAAVELSRRGLAPRVIDKKDGPIEGSRALGVNPRTLELLEASGATERLLARGLRIRAGNVYDGDSRFLRIHVDRIPHRFNFMLALPQEKTEAVLVETLEELGSPPQWRTELLGVEPRGEGNPVCRIRGPKGEEELTPEILIGADGAHSTVRHALGLRFEGGSFDRDWGLADADMSGDLDHEELHLFLTERGIMGFIPIGHGRFRLVHDAPDVFAPVPRRLKVGKVHWQTTFRISHRQVSRYQAGNAYLAGDSAHIHSPAGARGMNLGIEDACWLSWLLTTGEAARYTGLRRPVGSEVVRATNLLTRIVASHNPVVGFLRRYVAGPVLHGGFVQKRVLTSLAGLDSPGPPWIHRSETTAGAASKS